MDLRKFLCLAGICAAFAGPGLAATYKCEATNFGRGGWIPPDMILGLSREKEAGWVYDALIHEAQGKPMEAKVVKRKDHLWRYKWRVKGANIKNAGTATLSYSVMLNLATKTYTINGVLHGYDNHISGSGTCAPMKG